MASLQVRNGSYRVLFCHHGKLHGFTLGKVSEGEARQKAAQVDYLLMRLRQKLLVLPEGTDIVTFLRHDGDPPKAWPCLPSASRASPPSGRGAQPTSLSVISPSRHRPSGGEWR